MSQEHEADPDVREPQAIAQRDWFSRLILWLVAAVLAVTLVVLGAAYLPDWWARRVADVVAANRTAGVLGGLACGLVFAALPLLALRTAVRGRRVWTERLIWAVVAAVLAVPNLLTLGVQLGRGQEGEVARLLLDARGQGFRGATLPGVLLGMALVVGSWVLLAGRRRRLHELDDLRTRLELRDTRDAGGREGTAGREPDHETGRGRDARGHERGRDRSGDLKEPRGRPDA